MERRLLYDRWEVVLEAVQLSASSRMTSSATTPILAPLRLSASLHTCKLRDPALPATRARLSLGAVDVALGPCKLAALRALGTATASAASANGQTGSATAANPDNTRSDRVTAKEPKVCRLSPSLTPLQILILVVVTPICACIGESVSKWAVNLVNEKFSQ